MILRELKRELEQLLLRQERHKLQAIRKHFAALSINMPLCWVAL